MRVMRVRRPACVHVCTHEHTVGGRGGETEPSGRGSWLEHGRELCIRQPSAHRPHWTKPPAARMLCGQLLAAPEISSFPGQLLRKSSSAPPIPGQKVLAPWGAAQTHPPTRPRSLLGQLAPCCTRTGYPICLSVAQVVYLKTRPPQIGLSCPRQVPPQEPQRELIKEKRKVTFKWHRGSREVAQVPPGAGG